jgi:coenzyme F420-reducing hydrogenase alpha subunit
MESAAGVQLTGGLRALRRLIYCGEWIESHALHVYFLHAPDFLGYDNAIAMGADFPEQVQMGLRLKKIGNQIMALVGGREIHPINIRVGGFYRVPTKKELETLVPDLEWALEAALATTRWVSGFPFPDFERDYEFVALRHPGEYAIHEGRIVSNRGLDIGVDEWGDYFEESHVEWSNALHARRKDGGSYHLGPMARYSLNSELLTPAAREIADSVGLGPTCTNPFRSIVVRAVEIAFACEEALRLIAGYSKPDSPSIEVEPRDVVAHGASEAPRGMLYHRYEVDSEGLITEAHIVPPTSQNQLSIEDDLRAYVVGRTHLADAQLQWELEQAIRSYDPCISCATHFLDLTVDRE